LGCDITQTSGIYGGHVGYQYQFGSLVVGVEASLSKPSDHFGAQPCFNAAVNCLAETEYLATIGPRLGWAVSNWMVYGTAGYAHGKINTKEVAGGVENAFSTHGGNDGWFAGVGGEYALTRNVILGVEYMHIGLDTTWNFVTAAAEHRNISADYDIVRARLSWKFNTEERARPLK
jgi:outer membrane immunogenic protein